MHIDDVEARTPIRHPSVAGALGGLGHPQRVRIVGALVEGRAYVSELARRLEMNRPLLHMHLRRLEQAGLVTSALELSPEGKAMRFYEVTPFDIHITPASVAAAAHEARDGAQPPDDAPGD